MYWGRGGVCDRWGCTRGVRDDTDVTGEAGVTLEEIGERGACDQWARNGGSVYQKRDASAEKMKTGLGFAPCVNGTSTV